MKKLFIIFALLGLLVGCSLNEGIAVEGIWYTFDDSTQTASVTYQGTKTPKETYRKEYSGAVVIPSSVTARNTTYRVASIGEKAFSYCRDLSSVLLPNSLTEIKDSAFYYCVGLTSLHLPDGLTAIRENAFDGCSGLTSISLPNTITRIESRVFMDCISLTSVTIPNSVTEIGEYAFASCAALTSVTIPNGVIRIEECAFYDCSGLASVSIGQSVTTIGEGAFRMCVGLTSVTNRAAAPQAIDADVFFYADLAACTLYVPAASLDAYRAAEGWKEFGAILPIE